ncbi:hypothetical protein KR059_007084 [Drosophila kikkawai]|nr:hypothetical protein KR059_007084 [Drosophila kikkawai]
MPYFVMLNYFMDLLYSLVHFSHLGKQRAVVMNVTNVFGYIYTVFDMFLILVSLILTLGTRIEESGVILLLIGRVIHRLLLSIWSMLLYYLFSECQDMGCLLMLLATKAKMHAEKRCPKMEVSSYHLLLLGARLCLCCMFLIWMDEDLNVSRDFKRYLLVFIFLITSYSKVIFNILSLLLFISIGLGFYCKVCSYLTLLVLMYHDIFSNHWSMLFGWNDYFLSMNYFAMFFGKIGAFLMLSELGAGKWSMDSYLGLNDYERDQKGGYKIIKEQATA